MIGYVTLGTDNFDRACDFYDKLTAELGGGRMMDFGETFRLYGNSPNAPMIAVCKPHDKQPHTVSNGGMTAFSAKDKAQVDRLHALALSLGASDEGAPGPRTDTFYAAYFRDLDGNKLAAFYFG